MERVNRTLATLDEGALHAAGLAGVAAPERPADPVAQAMLDDARCEVEGD